MIVLDDLRGAQTAATMRAHAPGPNFITIGNFDGVHLGHQALLARARTLAAGTAGGKSVMITFNPHPAAVLRAAGEPLRYLSTPQERVALAAELGVDVGIIQPFTKDLAALQARAFVMLLRQNLNMAGLVVGPDFALGHKRAGDIPTLRILGDELGFVVDVVDAVTWRGLPVRSSAVRERLQAGDMETAAGMLGRLYAVEGIVQKGDQRGRTIGIPTANLIADPLRVNPANGVYATITRILDEPPNDTTDPTFFQSVTNIGVRPTVDGLHHTTEAHLLDFPHAGISNDLYGKRLRLEFVARLRDEQRFAGLDALVAQIQQDIEAARALFRSVAQ